MKRKWEDLSEEEKKEFEEKAGILNKEGLGVFASLLLQFLDEGILSIKDGRPEIDAKYAVKMFTEQGIPRELWIGMINNTLNEAKGQKLGT